MRNYGLFIANEWREGIEGKTFSSINPFTQKPWATLQEASASDVDAAVAAAREAYENVWSRLSGNSRAAYMIKIAELMEQNAEQMSVLESTDNGKVIRETKPQMMFVARLFRFYAGYADKLFGGVIPLDQPDVLDFTMREPYGVVGIITAWNSPMSLLANKLPAALAAGNCAVVKPSEHASVTTLEFCKLLQQSGLPAGVVNVVTGAGETGAALVAHPDIDKISFTGSDAVGRKIAAVAGQNLTPVALELGGKSPNIIFNDARLDRAITGALAGIFAATGQSCIAGSRLLVERGVYHDVIDGLAQRATKIVLGDPLDTATEMGTTANRPQFDRILAAIERAKAEGARLVAGGAQATGGNLDAGLFIQPTIFADVTNDMQVAREEIFGPVLSVIPFDTEDEAVEIANASNYGLAAGVWSTDISRCMRLVKKLKSGVVWVNTYRAVAAQAPFGGMKDSGFGRERGEQGLLDFTTIKNVMIDFSEQERDPFAIKN